MNKKTAFLALFLCCLFPIRNANAQSGLVAYFPFNGTADDASGNLNNGTATNATLVADRLGNANSAFSFDGTTSKVVIPNSASLAFPAGQDFTIELWLRCPSTIGNYAGLVVKAMADGEPGIPWFQFVLQDGKALFEVGNYSTGANTSIQGTTNLANNLWHRIAVVVARSTTTARIIVDGQIEKESSHALYGLSFTNTKNLVIGTERNNSRFFKGDLDEIRI
ncbi:MAG: LamG domain-containing protein, partial [Ignavibacteriales bacterium]|nr:LamG domain-containing protein [Ignavibacteriales bacterium]